MTAQLVEHVLDMLIVIIAKEMLMHFVWSGIHYKALSCSTEHAATLKQCGLIWGSVLVIVRSYRCVVNLCTCADVSGDS